MGLTVEILEEKIYETHQRFSHDFVSSQCYECDGVKGGGGLCPGNEPWAERQVNFLSSYIQPHEKFHLVKIPSYIY